MRNLITFIKEFKIPKKQELFDAKASFSKKQYQIWVFALLVAFVSMVMIVSKLNNSFMVEVPAKGGSITEGIIGTPTLVNPVLALSDADKDLTTLVYSGLMRKTTEGEFIPDLAESYEVSANGMTYTFILKKDLKFHDGAKLTADDVIFTIEKIKDPLIKSPRKLGWDGISVSKTDDYTVVFNLNQPYISFLDNTVIGILPMHIWKNINPAEFNLSTLNIKAIGSGTYKINSVSKDKEGVPEVYELSSYKDFALGVPNIKKLTMVSFANEKDLIKAMLSNDIDQASGLSPENASDIEEAGYSIHEAKLPRIFGLFFNSNNNKVLADTSVIRAFDKALDKEELINKILYGYGSVSDSPVPSITTKDTNTKKDITLSLEEARDILDKAGWIVKEDGIRVKGGSSVVTRTKKVGKKTVTEKVPVNNGPVTRLSFSITTGDTPELKDAAMLIKEQLAKVGAEIEVKIHEPGPLSQNIRSRNYEALFFGQIINHESDLYSFWHGSQRQDPGLNIAMYSNKNADALLESAQKTLDKSARMDKYESFVNEFNKDTPALLIYSPKYLYATLPKLNNLQLNTLTNPSDRFVSIHNWYAEKDHVWKIFTK